MDIFFKSRAYDYPKGRCFACFLRVFIFALFLNNFSLAENLNDNEVKKTEDFSSSKEESQSTLKNVLIWPFSHVIQPVLNGIVYPFAAPFRYAINEGLMERSIDLITFGKKKNIIIYPTMNLKPGTQTQLGFSYRHRSLIFNYDYLVLQESFYANGDFYGSIRYSKQKLLGLPIFGVFRYKIYFDSDETFIIPGTKNAFVYADSSIHLDWRVGMPLTESKKLNVEFSFSQKFIDASPPTSEKDSILDDKIFPIADRGLYQKSLQFPFEVSLVYDNLDFPYAPSKGSRIILSGEYVHVQKYEGIRYSDIYSDRPGKIRMSEKNHDYISNTFIFQHYFYFGQTKQYMLTAKESRQSRKFYTDFNWDEALRIWRPENIRETLFERRVLALQFRMENLWEMEKGGAPFNAFPRMNARFPLRGYGDVWSAYHLMGLSTEYRWPIDRFIDGVLFDEYGLHAKQMDDWSLSRFYNSWGFGVRVRMPDLYLFRVQVGFHGLHGINLVLTIAPEFK